MGTCPDHEAPPDKQASRGARGGRARAEALTPERRSEIATAAATARWSGSTDVAGKRRRHGALVRAAQAILVAVGEDSERPGLLETPDRVARAWDELTSGYSMDPGAVIKTFVDGAERVDAMVTVGPIPFFSLCEHHLLPFFGDAWVGYVPDGLIVGLSKMARLVDVFARRLQVQERLTNQIADAFVEHVRPRGVGVHIRARHLCMEMRVIARLCSQTTTTALRGVIRDKPEARAEFMGACR